MSRSRDASLRSLAEEFYQSGTSDLLSALLDERPYTLVQQPQRTLRTDVPEDLDHITYLDFNPAGHSNGYSISRIELSSQYQRGFIYHAGEELLFPISGSINYHFLVPIDGKLSVQTLSQPLRPGDNIRLNASIPHHAWSTDGASSHAWMIVRHLSNREAAVNLDEKFEHRKNPQRRRFYETPDFGCYALIAWDIAETLRLARQEAGLKIQDVAAAAGIDAAHLSRIEDGTANVSLEKLKIIAKLLSVSLQDLIPRQEPQAFVSGSGAKVPNVLGGCRTQLHAERLSWGEGERTERSIPPRSSWICVSGTCRIELTEPERKEPHMISLSAGEVLHFHASQKAFVTCAMHTSLIEVRFNTSDGNATT